MSMKSVIGGVVILFSITSLSIAQATPPAGKSGQPVDRQKAGKRKVRRINRPGQGPLTDPKTDLGWLNKALSLDETQQAEITKLLEAYHARLLEIRETHGQSKEEMEQWMNLRNEMKQAHEEKDEAKLKELQKQIRELQQARRKRTAPAKGLQQEARKALREGITALLKDEQKEKFEQLWQDRFLVPDRLLGRGRTPRVLRSLVYQLDDLNADQRKKIDDLYKVYLKSIRGSKKTGSREQAKQLEQQLFTDVLAVLTPEQKQYVEGELASRQGRRPRRVGRSGPGRFGRPTRPDPAKDEPKTDG